MNFNTTLAQSVQSRILEYGSLVTALLVISIYFSTSLGIVLSVLLGMLWVLSAQIMALPGTLKRNPVAAWSLFMFIWFIVGSCYTSAATGDALSMIMKYRELIFIPVLISFLTTERRRNRVWSGFVIASVLVLLISYLMQFGILGLNKQGDPAIKSRITHSIFISFFAFFCAHKAFDCNRYAKLYLALLLFSVYNLFFIVEGRIGQLTAILLLLLFALQRLSKKALLLTVLVIVLFLAFFLAFSDKATRINEGVVNIQSDLQPDAREIPSSMGQRYMYWRYSLQLIAEKPLMGHGTGSFAKEYQRVASKELFITKNPHNEFFLITIQLGVLGLLIYLGFLASQYYYAKRLPEKEKWLAQGILLSLIVTSVFNSPLFDNAEGHWFACMIALCFASLQADSKTEINHA